ncbi:dubious [Schizosaccharomyces pombe]|uniref:Uncharacterized protein C1F3.08c n=1 Tax=Schizosaccharomyces pombe (strain 972 / ATCC 24843) TaxID=284812 RepID=YD88_SCHPO|nr:uncharacterized protein SPAC1F3.08c [Schizosaccharomyces pombe]Q10413.1 RecName: Full=Uncharacterized protein C1F3.08c [Schizosaccharomyces pombe 972h-]CAA94626.1 dubious [Schizosaccharomyces pombe]|eukprot:NP_593011.1 uncharacterized protein SPAC1F3.08c [Schizosaccharomyces pombe]
MVIYCNWLELKGLLETNDFLYLMRCCYMYDTVSLVSNAPNIYSIPFFYDRICYDYKNILLKYELFIIYYYYYLLICLSPHFFPIKRIRPFHENPLHSFVYRIMISSEA